MCWLTSYTTKTFVQVYYYYTLKIINNTLKNHKLEKYKKWTYLCGAFLKAFCKNIQAKLSKQTQMYIEADTLSQKRQCVVLQDTKTPGDPYFLRAQSYITTVAVAVTTTIQHDTKKTSSELAAMLNWLIWLKS